jgi:hypothetical protein
MRFELPASLLPEDSDKRYELLHSYFCDQRGKSYKDGDIWIVDTYWPDSPDYYVDPSILAGIAWWDRNLLLELIHKEVRQMPGWQLSLNDSWTLYSWSNWLAKKKQPPEEIAILHVDYHNDLMSPRISKSPTSFVDILTDSEFDLMSPDSVRRSILSGAIGVGSFMMPLLHTIKKVHLSHLCDGPLTSKTAHVNALTKGWQKDSLLALGEMRPNVSFGTVDAGINNEHISFRITDNFKYWLEGIPDVPVLLHIDMDYFNCRYDGDSDWSNHPPRHDPDYSSISKKMEKLFEALNEFSGKREIVDISVALSPGFFPVEYWEDSIAKLSTLISSMKA